eukprot:5403573-Pyramimonas_sp.AAC.1
MPTFLLCFTAPALCCTLAVNSPLLLANSPPHYVSLLYTVLHRTCAVLYPGCELAPLTREFTSALCLPTVYCASPHLRCALPGCELAPLTRVHCGWGGTPPKGHGYDRRREILTVSSPTVHRRLSLAHYGYVPGTRPTSGSRSYGCDARSLAPEIPEYHCRW